MRLDRRDRSERRTGMQPTDDQVRPSRLSLSRQSMMPRLFLRMPAASNALQCSRRQYWHRPWSDPRGGTDPSLAPVSPHHLLHDVSRDEGDVSWTLGEPPHEIRIPLRAEWHIHAHAITLAHQLLLEIAPYAVEHLEFELVVFDVALAGKPLHFSHDCFVVRCDAGIVPVGEEGAHAAKI